jgi:hypothetical protein
MTEAFLTAGSDHGDETHVEEEVDHNYEPRIFKNRKASPFAHRSPMLTS